MDKIFVEWPEHVHPRRLDLAQVIVWNEREIFVRPCGYERQIVKAEKIEVIDGFTRKKKEYNLSDKDIVFKILEANPFVFYCIYDNTLICLHYPRGTKFWGCVFITPEEAQTVNFLARKWRGFNE